MQFSGRLQNSDYEATGGRGKKLNITSGGDVKGVQIQVFLAVMEFKDSFWTT